MSDAFFFLNPPFSEYTNITSFYFASLSLSDRPPHSGSQPTRAHNHEDLFPHFVPRYTKAHPDTKRVLQRALSDQYEKSKCWAGSANSTKSPW